MHAGKGRRMGEQGAESHLDRRSRRDGTDAEQDKPVGPRGALRASRLGGGLLRRSADRDAPIYTHNAGTVNKRGRHVFVFLGMCSGKWGL